MRPQRKSTELLRIGDLANRAAVSHRTIHYYERLGLLQPARREGAGYRYYDATALKRLEKIAALKKLGLSLEEIASVIDLYFQDASGIRGKRKVLGILKSQLENTDKQLRELTKFRSEIKANIERMEYLISTAKE